MFPTIPPAVSPHVDVEALDADVRQPIAARSQLWRFHDEHVLGTRLTVLAMSSSAVLARAAADAARREIERLDGVFNDRRGDSELARLNQAGRIHASAELFAVVQLSEAWRNITRGAFDGRMGALLRLWRAHASPDRCAVRQTLDRLRAATVTLDCAERRIELAPTVELSLDAVAKGYIVDAALNAARRAAPTLQGIAVEVGGDIRCWGESPDARGWRIGIPDPIRPADNAPLAATLAIQNAAIATSGRGPRDCLGNGYRSTTISPFSGGPVRNVISASVVASHAADADAIATACMVLHPSESLVLVDRLQGVAVRITDARGRVHQSARWPRLLLAAANESQVKSSALPADLKWPADWELGMIYKAPDRRERRDADFRTPYMVLWITDMQNRPVRTVLMVGTDAEWQRDNYIWWTSHRERARQLVDLRSQATALSGRYPMYWSGIDDAWQPVPVGKYMLHLETSQERGKHSHRSVAIEIGRERFKTALPNLEDSGGLEITYGHYNDRFQSND